MITIAAGALTVQAWPCCNASPGCPRGLYWEMEVNGQEQPCFFGTADIFGVARELLTPKV